MNEPRLARLVSQHAMTSRLLGVDFVPSYQSGNPDRPVSEVVEAKPAPVSAKAPIFVAVDDRRSSARAALEALREQYIADAPHQHFVTDHHSIVFGEGDPCARLMFIGEAPGAEEDRTGRPFVGPAGQLLDKMIAAMGLGREDVYIANVLKTRPPNNATPTTEEARLCAPYLFEQIRIISPEAIVTLGRPASQLLLGTTESMGRLRGHWAQFPPPEPLAEVAGFDPIPVMPTYHPAYVLRQYTADTRQRVWSDLQQVMELLGLKARA